EPVATQPSNRIGLPERRREAQRDLLEEQIADVVTQRVVDVLESVHVHDQQHQGLSFPACDRDRLAQSVIEQGSVRQTGQRIVKGLIFERILLSPLLGYVVHDPYEASLAAKEHFAGAEFHGKDRAIFPLSPQLTGTRDRDRALARPQIIAEVAHKVIAVRFSHEDLRILPLHLSQRVAEEPLRRAIENLDQAALVDGDDSIGNLVQNSPDKLRTFLQGSLYPRPFNELPDLASDVGHCRKEPLIRLEDLP